MLHPGQLKTITPPQLELFLRGAVCEESAYTRIWIKYVLFNLNSYCFLSLYVYRLFGAVTFESWVISMWQILILRYVIYGLKILYWGYQKTLSEKSGFYLKGWLGGNKLTLMILKRQVNLHRPLQSCSVIIDLYD